MISKAVVGALALAGGGLMAFPAGAAVIYLGLQEAGVNSGLITTVASTGATTGPAYGALVPPFSTYGTFTIRGVSGLDSSTNSQLPDFASTAIVQIPAGKPQSSP